jgi:hypothetical protein
MAWGQRKRTTSSPIRRMNEGETAQNGVTFASTRAIILRSRRKSGTKGNQNSQMARDRANETLGGSNGKIFR